MQLAPSLHQIGSNIVNRYLVEDAGQITIIDAGLPGQWGELLRELSRMGRSLDDVRALLLTHGDTDHIGFAGRLHRESTCTRPTPPERVARSRSPRPVGTGQARPAGRIRRLFRAAWRAAGTARPRLQCIQAGTTLDVPGSPRVIGMPGHTPGSVAYHVQAVDAVFVCDSMTTRSVLTGEVGPRPAPFTLEPAQAHASFERVSELEARWVLPKHGPAWSEGTAQAVNRYRSAIGASSGIAAA
jgi:glyoxylase-like metal-dependent hydrolase (beta-lactamase superfamily II)